MGLKFNCPNPECRQRIEVDDALAGAAMPCPACGAEVHVPTSHDIRFACTNKDCGQHIVVEVSEAGRFVKCPACGKVLRVPGDPPKPLIPQPAPAKEKVAETHVPAPFAPLKRLAIGWGVGAAVLGLLLLGFHRLDTAGLPPHLREIYDEIDARSTAATNDPPVKSVFSTWVTPVQKTATNSSGQIFDYYYVPPATLEAGRKYPAIIDQSSSIRRNRMRDIEFLANAGIFYVSPNKFGITEWGVMPEEGNVLAVCAELAKNPHIDSERLYVMGQSRTIDATIRLVNAYPELWRGAILMEPAGGFPTIPDDAKGFPCIFIAQGRDDPHNRASLRHPGVAEKNFLKASARMIPVRIDYEYGGHGFPPEQLKRAYLAAVKFILSDYGGRKKPSPQPLN